MNHIKPDKMKAYKLAIKLLLYILMVFQCIHKIYKGIAEIGINHAKEINLLPAMLISGTLLYGLFMAKLNNGHFEIDWK